MTGFSAPDAGVLLAVVASIAAFFVASTRRWRRVVFGAVCALGVAAAIVGWTRFSVAVTRFHSEIPRVVMETMVTNPHEPYALKYPSYFVSLGLPLSLVIVFTLCFAIFEIDRVFTRLQRRAWLYPLLSWYFVVWLTCNLVYLLVVTLQVREQFGAVQSDLAAWMGFYGVLVGAFVISTVRGFPFGVFRLGFPLGCVMLAATMGLRLSLSRSATLQKAVLDNPWDFVFLLGYFYVNAKVHDDRLKHPLIKRLPGTAALLIVMSLVHEFPETDVLRRVVPLGVALAEGVLVAIDVAFVAAVATLAFTGQLAETSPASGTEARPT